uniref:2-isopropylmalate synthase n=2 Tax=Grammatophora oceanica TaxID=210454 RepID=A0A7S1VQR5_9STRA
MIDLEHFFDGYKADPEYVKQCCQAAVDAGAAALVLCDTNGGTMPWQVEEATKEMVEEFGDDVTIGIHAHNDCNLAVANSLCAAKAGAGLIQGTINGIGERTGNADLCSIIPTLALKEESNMGVGGQLHELTSVSKFVDELLGRIPNPAAPYVGSSAFCHKGGLHVAAMERNADSYQHIEPTLVGNERRTVVSELAGRQTILGKMRDAGVETESDRAMAILNRVKRLESKGYTFEGAEASVHLMILHASRGYCPPFKVLDYSVQVYDSNMDSASRVMQKQMQSTNEDNDGDVGPTARATVKVRTLNLDEDAYSSMDEPLLFKDHLEVSDGNGPVDALAQALMRSLVPSHPTLSGMQLVDYKVRILDPESATGASTRVMIEFRDGDATWTTTSVDRNIISASVNALVDGFEYALIEHAQSCMLCEDAF